eukprot:CAMPEP_0204600612 /NCGR_PEP_ID=MMETSP0661-20131031/55546_1 /ASSEMBLY_ACC=CAM_ASM_000606 /TAXON_ID=109239 /ORGANISM="Alexandrium margalefi, Strain AMGDE01CS-322" /LENGTH=389 /DNA_ID=CAMNT_0051611429 /DNA_START=1 /DNA_END=1170 /DNA_ORIENTATION=-
MELRVTTKKSIGFYVRAASGFLRGADAREAGDDGEALEARPPVDFLRVTALGDAINVAAAVVGRLEAEGVGEVMGVQTSFPRAPGGRICSQMVVRVKRKGASFKVPLIKYQPFPSTNIKPRPVHVWLPEGYEADTDRYSVLYMHDGQNLFDDAAAAFGTSWSAADILSPLIKDGTVRKVIVVGIFNGEALRFREYVPEPVLERVGSEVREKLLAQPQYGGPPLSGGYVRFLVDELKPFVDKNYRTKPDRSNTFVMGSSMGGLISLHTLASHPDVFGAAGCLSTHWPLSIDDETLDKEAEGWRDAVCKAFQGYLEEALPAAGDHRFWFDYGTEHLDAHYEPYQNVADSVFASKGYKQGVDVATRSYPGADHNEASWRDRFKEPLAFLLGK